MIPLSSQNVPPPAVFPLYPPPPPPTASDEFSPVTPPHTPTTQELDAYDIRMAHQRSEFSPVTDDGAVNVPDSWLRQWDTSRPLEKRVRKPRAPRPKPPPSAPTLRTPFSSARHVATANPPSTNPQQAFFTSHYQGPNRPFFTSHYQGPNRRSVTITKRRRQTPNLQVTVQLPGASKDSNTVALKGRQRQHRRHDCAISNARHVKKARRTKHQPLPRPTCPHCTRTILCLPCGCRFCENYKDTLNSVGNFASAGTMCNTARINGKKCGPYPPRPPLGRRLSEFDLTYSKKLIAAAAQAKELEEEKTTAELAAATHAAAATAHAKAAEQAAQYAATTATAAQTRKVEEATAATMHSAQEAAARTCWNRHHLRTVQLLGQTQVKQLTMQARERSARRKRTNAISVRAITTTGHTAQDDQPDQNHVAANARSRTTRWSHPGLAASPPPHSATTPHAVPAVNVNT